MCSERLRTRISGIGAFVASCAPLLWWWCDDEGDSPMLRACRYGHLEAARILRAHGAAVDMPNLNRVQPIHEAAMDGSLEVLEWLVENGCPEM